MSTIQMQGQKLSALTLLTHSGVTPRVQDCFEQDEWLFVMMDYVPGVNAQTLLDQNGLDQGRQIYKQLGTYLAGDVHGLEFVPSGIRSRVREALSVSDQGKLTLIHGDFGPLCRRNGFQD